MHGASSSRPRSFAGHGPPLPERKPALAVVGVGQGEVGVPKDHGGAGPASSAAPARGIAVVDCALNNWDRLPAAHSNTGNICNWLIGADGGCGWTLLACRPPRHAPRVSPHCCGCAAVQRGRCLVTDLRWCSLCAVVLLLFCCVVLLLCCCCRHGVPDRPAGLADHGAGRAARPHRQGQAAGERSPVRRPGHVLPPSPGPFRRAVRLADRDRRLRRLPGGRCRHDPKARRAGGKRQRRRWRRRP